MRQDGAGLAMPGLRDHVSHRFAGVSPSLSIGYAAATNPTLIEPLTPTGRVTLTLLEMNGPRHVQVRQWLIALGIHPPQ